MDPNVVLWPEDKGLTRADQEESIRTVNALGSNSPLTPAQREMLNKLYNNNLNTPGTKSADKWFPPAWDDTDAHRDLFDKVIKPNCAPSHLALETAPTGQPPPIFALLKSPPPLMSPGPPADV